jgi:hypothetical protein
METLASPRGCGDKVRFQGFHNSPAATAPAAASLPPPAKLPPPEPRVPVGAASLFESQRMTPTTTGNFVHEGQAYDYDYSKEPDDQLGNFDGDDMEVPKSFHQLTVVCICNEIATPRLKLSMLAVSYGLVALQLAGLVAMTYSTAQRSELEGLYGHAREVMIRQQESGDIENVRSMTWSDWGMLILVNAVVAFSMQKELEEIIFTDNWFRQPLKTDEEELPDDWPKGLVLTTKPRPAYRFAIEILMAVRAFCLVSGVLAISPIIIFSDGADAKNLALNAVAAIWVVELDDLLLEHGTPLFVQGMLPKAILVSKREADARDCSYAGLKLACIYAFVDTSRIRVPQRKTRVTRSSCARC